MVQACRAGFFPGTDLRTVPCAVVGDTWTGGGLDGFELGLIGLRGSGSRIL